MLELLSRTLSDISTWSSEHSRSRLSSVDGLSLQANSAHEAISDLQGVLRVVQSLDLKQIPYNDLRKKEWCGEGETFTVVKHLWKDRVVAVKHIKKKLLDATENQHMLKRQLRSVLQEILVMQHGPVAGHPSVISLIGYGWQLSEGRPLPYIVVEYAALGDLRSFLKSKPSGQYPANYSHPHSNWREWPLKHKMLLAGDIAAGLMTLHECGIVHGDLKLDNVIVVPDPYRIPMCRAKLCDFGHAISLSTEEDAVYYYGTPLYLSPEALDQKDRPIQLENLHKCDIWAFGLALWEIIADGQPYFQNAWFTDSRYTKSSSMSGSFQAGDESIPTRPTAPSATSSFVNIVTLTETVADDESMGSTDLPTVIDSETDSTLLESVDWPDSDVPDQDSAVQSPRCLDSYKPNHYFGHFDLGNLQHLSQEALRKAEPLHSWERSYLGPLLRLTLNSDPSKRIANLYRSPLLKEWCSNVPESSLQAQLAMHTRTTDNIFNMFRPDRQRPIAWEHQILILGDYQKIVDSGHEGSRLGFTSFQLMICNALGFGCEINFVKAHQYLRRAIEQGTSVAAIFGDALGSIFAPALTIVVEPFETRLVKVFLKQRYVNEMSAIYLCRCDTDGQEDTIDIRATASLSSSVLLKLATQRTGMNEQEVLCNTSLFIASQPLKCSWLEFAILNDDTALLQICCKAFQPTTMDKPGVWNETPLILACRKGRTDMIKTLLTWGADPLQCAGDGYHMLHWLFCLQNDAPMVLDLIMQKIATTNHNKINQICSKMFQIDPQWPTELTGSPLSFAVIANQHALVKRLLHHGANPFIQLELPSPPGGFNLTWTPVHLAVKYNFSKILFELLSANRTRTPPPQTMATALAYLTSVERFGIHGKMSKEKLLETINVLPPELLARPLLDGTTPLWQAIDYENAEVAAALLEVRPELAGMPIRNPKDMNCYIWPLHHAAQICARRGSSDALTIPKCVFSTYNNALTMVDENGSSALHFSVTANSSQVTQWLLSIGGLVNATDTLLRTPLMLCRSAENTRLLLQFGARINCLDADEMNSAHHAIAKGADDSLRVLIDNKINLNQVARIHGTPLHLAVHTSSLGCIDQLCEAKANVNLANGDGDTPLHLAVLSKRSDIVKTLLDCGATSTAANYSGQTPTTVAIRQIGLLRALDAQSQLQVFDALVTQGGQPAENKRGLIDILHNCARMGGHDLIQYFLSHETVVSRGVDANSLQGSMPPIHSAVEYGRVGAARALIARGADLNAQDKDGATPLMTLCSAACEEGNKLQLCDLLLSKDANFSIKNKRGQTVWDLAYEQPDFSILARLLEIASDVQLWSMLQKAKITWEMTDRALSLGHPRFVNACLAHPRHIQFLQSQEVVNDIAKALGCGPTSEDVAATLKSLIRGHADLVIDAIHGKSVTKRYRNRNLLPLERRIRWFGNDDSWTDQFLFRGMTRAIRDYLAKFEPSAARS